MSIPVTTLDDVVGVISAPGPDDDKYSRGVLGLLVGSLDYPGAAVLATEAALRAGVGMARLSAAEPVTRQVVAVRPEAVIASGRIDALVVGCGIGNDARDEIASRLRHFHYSEDVPVVVDAGALLEASWLPGRKILTPHAGEMTSLAETLQLPGDTPASWAHALAATWNVVVLLKGHHSVVYGPSGVIHRLPPGTPWLASAGTGDVLAGLLGALLAQGKSETWDDERIALMAATAALIHQEAASRVSLQSGAGRPGPLLAHELARAISPVIASIVAQRSGD